MNVAEKAVKMVSWCQENGYWADFFGESKTIVIYPFEDDLERWVIDLNDNSMVYQIKIGNLTWSEGYFINENVKISYEYLHKEHIGLLNAFRKYILEGFKRSQHDLITWCDFSNYSLHFHTNTVKIESVCNSQEWILINLDTKKISLYSFKDKEVFNFISKQLKEIGVLE